MLKKLSLACVLNAIVGVFILMDSFDTLMIITRPEMPDTVTWNGCIYKRLRRLTGNEKTECLECINRKTIDLSHIKSNGIDNMARFSAPPKQNYTNCSIECERPTICTDYVYLQKDGGLKTECYQCENLNDEVIAFEFKRSYEICSDECRNCAEKADLTTAIFCSPICRGKPTFCFPTNDIWFGKRKCYRAKKLFGCIYKEIKEIPEGACRTCVKLANKIEYAHECSADCNGLPSYSLNGSDANSFKYFQCKPYYPFEKYVGGNETMEIFDHDIPKEIKYFIKDMEPVNENKPV